MRRTLFSVPAAATLLLVLALTPGQVAAQGIDVELSIATAVQDREPVGVGTQFPNDVGTLYAWMRVTGAANQSIEVIWTHGPHSFAVPLEVGGSPWRTWSSKVIPPAWGGTWTVEVRHRDGRALASTTFQIG